MVTMLAWPIVIVLDKNVVIAAEATGVMLLSGDPEQTGAADAAAGPGGDVDAPHGDVPKPIQDRVLPTDSAEDPHL